MACKTVCAKYAHQRKVQYDGISPAFDENISVQWQGLEWRPGWGWYITDALLSCDNLNFTYDITDNKLVSVNV